MVVTRKAFQGVGNIIRFNWHFFALAASAIALLLLASTYTNEPYHKILLVFATFASITILISLVVSHYVYDISGLYKLEWLGDLSHQKILTINAGFDETSTLIQHTFQNTELIICDFYNPQKHTETSIKRARRAYPPSADTISINTNKLPFEDQSVDKILAILSAHEIRDNHERILFFEELLRITKPQGVLIVTEHLRDFWNFTAYTFGVFHFHSKKTWLDTFKQANWHVKEEFKITPFITTFILENHGNTP